MNIEIYQKAHKSLWDEFVQKSKNGNFLFLRDYMEYHQDRFHDSSLLIFDNQKLIALLPAHIKEKVFASHLGLTFGGFITSETMKVPIMLDIFEVVLKHLKEKGCNQFLYKTTPHIHHKLPAEEDRYALFRLDAKLFRRDAFSIVMQDCKVPYQERRLRSIKKALKANIKCEFSLDLKTYWDILCTTLEIGHGVKPVHSLEEIKILQSRFPQHIKLYACFSEKKMLAGVIVYETDLVARSQYIAATEEGKESGALDLLFSYLLENVYKKKKCFDFGPSNEQNGRFLNKGLIDQKEGFGARALVHDHYLIEL